MTPVVCKKHESIEDYKAHKPQFYKRILERFIGAASIVCKKSMQASIDGAVPALKDV